MGCRLFLSVVCGATGEHTLEFRTIWRQPQASCGETLSPALDEDDEQRARYAAECEGRDDDPDDQA